MSRIDYDLNLIQAMVFDIDGVLSPNTVPLSADGTPQRMVNIKDGYAIKLAIKRGYKIAIISGASGDALKRRFAILGINDVFFTQGQKLPVLEQWMSDNKLNCEQVVYAGDDVPDLDCMKAVGLSVAPADSADDVLEIARYISPVNGGHGVARDIIEQIMRVQGCWPTNAEAFGS